MPCDLEITQAAACDSGIGKLDNELALLRIIAQLSCEIADASASGGGCFQCSSGAGAPVAAPSVTTQPAQYRDTTSGFNYRWDVQSQSWAAIPKVYRALLTQAGTNAPTAAVLENTLGNITFVYNAVGEYEIQSAALFTNAKTFYTPNSFIDPISADIGISVLRNGASSFGVSSFIWSTSIATNNLLSQFSIEILVYP